MSDLPTEVREFAATEEQLDVVEDGIPFGAIVGVDEDYFSVPAGLVVCVCDGDVFVLHTFEEEIGVLGEDSLVDLILPQRQEDLLGRLALDEWSLAEEVSDGHSVPAPYSAGLLAELSTEQGIVAAVREGVAIVRSLLDRAFVESLHASFSGYEMPAYESEPWVSSSSARRRVGEIAEWSHDHLRIFVCDVDDADDGVEREKETVGKVYVDAGDVWYEEGQVEKVVDIVAPEEADIVGADEDGRYEVGVRMTVDSSSL